MNRFYNNKIKINSKNVWFYDTLVKGYIVGLSFFITLQINKLTAFADSADEKPLTALFKTEAFRGSWKVFEKYNWLGQILNWIISSVCFISLFCIVLSLVITLSYFALRPFWDTVHEIKKENVGGGNGWTDVLGIGNYVKGSLFSTKTSGLDSLVNLFYIFVPDVYAKSEMNEENRDPSLKSEDTVVTWLVKTGWKKVFIMLILSMGFNGTLMQCFGMVVDGLGVFGDRVASYRMDTLVNNILDSGDNYHFTLGDTGVSADVVKGNIAKECYKLVLGTVGADNQTSVMKQTIGKNIESRIRSEITKERMNEMLIKNGQSSDFKLSEDDWNYIKYTVEENTDSKGNSGSDVISMSDVVGQGSYKTSRYLHITPVLSKRAPIHDYLKLSK